MRIIFRWINGKLDTAADRRIDSFLADHDRDESLTRSADCGNMIYLRD